MGESLSHAEASAFLDAAPCGLLQTDARGLILWANRLFCSWVDCEHADVVGHRTIQELFSAGGRIFHQTHWVPLMQMQHSVSEVKFDLLRADGQSVPVIVNGTRVLHDGVIVHNLALFIARDRDTYERELVKAGERLKTIAARAAELEVIAKDRAIFAEQMMGIVSHDLRNPLASIEMSAMAIATGDLGDRQRAALARIHRASSRAARLIHDLLDFTQARIGKGMGITRTAVNLHEVVADSVEELRAAFPNHDVQHRSVGAGQCDADADRLMQLVGNLVTNAIAYGRRDTPVEVTSRILEDACAITVHNMGTPIEADLLTALFEPMTRGTAVDEGTRSIGLGLYIVREIAKAHDGAVTVSSNADDGTTFTMTFVRHCQTD